MQRSVTLMRRSRSGRQRVSTSVPAGAGAAPPLDTGAAVLFTAEDDRALLEFDGSGNAERAQVKTLRATMPTGALDATGTVADHLVIVPIDAELAAMAELGTLARQLDR